MNVCATQKPVDESKARNESELESPSETDSTLTENAEVRIDIDAIITPSPSTTSLNTITPSTSVDTLNGISAPQTNASKIVLPSTKRKFRLKEIFQRQQKIQKKEMGDAQTKCTSHWTKVKQVFAKCLPKRSYAKKKAVPSTLYNDMTPEDQNRVRSLIIDLGFALSVFGVPAHKLEEHLTRVSTYYGLDGSYFSTPTAIWFSFGSKPSEMTTSYHLVRVKSNAIDLHKLCLIDDLAYAISKGKYSLKEARMKMNEIIDSPTNYENPFVQIISYSLAALSMSIFMDGTWAELLAAAISGLVVGLLGFGASKYAFISKLFTISSALSCGLIAVLFKIICSNSVKVSVFLVSLSGVIALVPGLTLTLSMAEISTNNILSGAARLTRVLITALQLGFGVAIVYAFGSFFSTKEVPSQWVSPEWLIFIANLLATTAYSIQFHAPQYPFAVTMMYISACSGYYVSKYAGLVFGSEIAPMFGALVIGVAGNIYGKITKHPGIVVTAVGILILVPGSISVRGMNALLEKDAISGIFFIFNMFMIGLSLVIGLFISNFILPNKRLNL